MPHLHGHIIHPSTDRFRSCGCPGSCNLGGLMACSIPGGLNQTCRQYIPSRIDAHYACRQPGRLPHQINSQSCCMPPYLRPAVDAVRRDQDDVGEAVPIEINHLQGQHRRRLRACTKERLGDSTAANQWQPRAARPIKDDNIGAWWRDRPAHIKGPRTCRRSKYCHSFLHQHVASWPSTSSCLAHREHQALQGAPMLRNERGAAGAGRQGRAGEAADAQRERLQRGRHARMLWHVRQVRPGQLQALLRAGEVHMTVRVRMFMN